MFDARNPPNWRGQQNPWSLASPPVWWLKRLWARDSKLVIFPGITECCYRVARIAGATRLLRTVLSNDSETARMIRESCLPVVSLKPGITWNNDLFTWLDQRDTWAFRNAYKGAAERLDEIDREAAVSLDKRIADDCDQRSVSAYDALQLRTGQKVFVHAPLWSVMKPEHRPGSPSHAAPG